MAKCIKRMITCTCKISIPKLSNAKEIDETRENGRVMTKCVKQMISFTRKINILTLPNTIKIDETKELLVGKQTAVFKHIFNIEEVKDSL